MKILIIDMTHNKLYSLYSVWMRIIFQIPRFFSSFLIYSWKQSIDYGTYVIITYANIPALLMVFVVHVFFRTSKYFSKYFSVVEITLQSHLMTHNTLHIADSPFLFYRKILFYRIIEYSFFQKIPKTQD